MLQGQSEQPMKVAKNKSIIRELLREYYSEAQLRLPDNYMLREFAFQPFESKSYVRHLSFQSIASLREYLTRQTPRQAYYSAAIYRDPAAERMEDKGWLGSELMFDIDVDHIKGCDNVTIEVKEGKFLNIITDKCINLGKEHLLRLIDVLTQDFGFSKSEILMYFTGNRGFHVVVETEKKEWLTLNSKERRELVDYVKGIGLDLSRLITRSKRIKPTQPLPVDGGWRGRIARSGIDLDTILQDPESVIERTYIEVDEQVTQDLSRLVRIPGSINGKSGLMSKILNSESDIIDFHVGEHLSPFRGFAIIRSLIKTPSLNLWGTSLSLSEGQLLKVSLPAAVFLALNGAAEIIRIL